MFFMEKILDNQIFTDWSKGMLFPINNMSSTYNIKKTTLLLLKFFINTRFIHIFYESNCLIISSKQIFQLLEACLSS